MAFGFGNRLVSFSNTMQQGQDGQMVGAGTITIQQVGRLPFALYWRACQEDEGGGRVGGWGKEGTARLAPVLSGFSACVGLNVWPHCP